MISGHVTDELEAVIQVPVHVPTGKLFELIAIVDTGFTGSLTLPAAVIASLGLPWRGKTEAVLANGMVTECDVYVATILWDGGTRTVLVEAAETDPLLGMAMLKGFEWRVQVTAGGSLTLAAIG